MHAWRSGRLREPVQAADAASILGLVPDRVVLWVNFGAAPKLGSLDLRCHKDVARCLRTLAAMAGLVADVVGPYLLPQLLPTRVEIVTPAGGG